MTNSIIRGPFPWFGGKGGHRIREAVLRALVPHKRYLEAFGGGASILLAKQPAEVEVYNDVNRGLVNFFRVISDVDMFGKFMARAALLPVSRELYEEYARTWPGIHDPLEQAVRWYYIARQSFGGMFGKSFGTGVNSTSCGMSSRTAQWISSFDNLPPVHQRMQRVQIECCDWRDVLKRFSGPDWLAYCDPPYVTGTRKAGGYEHELHDRDHEELVRTLLGYDGAVVLSGYDNALYAPLREAGWEMQTVDVVCCAAGRTRASGLQGAGHVKEKQRRVECIWRNPEALRRASMKS